MAPRRKPKEELADTVGQRVAGSIAECEEELLASVRWFESEADHQRTMRNLDGEIRALGMAMKLRSKHSQLAALSLRQIDNSRAMLAVIEAFGAANAKLKELTSELDELARDLAIAAQVLTLVTKAATMAISHGILA